VGGAVAHASNLSYARGRSGRMVVWGKSMRLYLKNKLKRRRTRSVAQVIQYLLASTKSWV
jgi:hypothetical protein